MTLDEIEKLVSEVAKRNGSSKFGDPRYSCRVGSDELLALLTSINALLPVARAALALSAAGVIDDGKKRHKAMAKAEEQLQSATWALEEKLKETPT